MGVISVYYRFMLHGRMSVRLEYLDHSLWPDIYISVYMFIFCFKIDFHTFKNTVLFFNFWNLCIYLQRVGASTTFVSKTKLKRGVCAIVLQTNFNLYVLEELYVLDPKEFLVFRSLVEKVFIKY